MKKLNIALKKFFKTFGIKTGDVNTIRTSEPVCGRELPGFRKKSFVLYYGGGEIWFEHLDGIYQYTELAVEKLCADSDFFCRPSAPSYIAFVLDETAVTDELILTISEKLKKSEKQFMRVAFIGANKKAKNNLKKYLKNSSFAVNFFKGIEPSKEWLIGGYAIIKS